MHEDELEKGRPSAPFYISDSNTSAEHFHVFELHDIHGSRHFQLQHSNLYNNERYNVSLAKLN